MTTAIATAKFADLHGNTKQPRGALRGMKELTASIAELGITMPVLVVASEDGKGYRIIDGHRRVAAAKDAGLVDVPIVVAPSDTAALEMARLMSTHLRDELTAVERAHGIQTLLDLGVKPTTVTKMTGAGKSAIEAAKTVAASKKAAAAVPLQASLEEAVAFVEFAGDKGALQELEGRVGTGQFAHSLERLRQNRVLQAKKQAAQKQLDKAHVSRVEDTWKQGVVRLSTMDIKPEDHAECPGHAAEITYHGEIVYWCTKAKLHGHGGGGVTGPLSDKEKAARKAKREGKALWSAATAVRREFIRGVCQARSKSANPALLPFTARVAWEHGLTQAQEQGYTTSWQMKLSAIARDLAGTEPSNVTGLFAQACAGVEHGIDGWADCWGGLDPKRNAPDRLVDYYDTLKACGYELAECEAAAVTAIAAVPKSKAEKRASRKAAADTDEDDEPEEIETVD